MASACQDYLVLQLHKEELSVIWSSTPFPMMRTLLPNLTVQYLQESLGKMPIEVHQRCLEVARTLPGSHSECDDLPALLLGRALEVNAYMDLLLP